MCRHVNRQPGGVNSIPEGNRCSHYVRRCACCLLKPGKTVPRPSRCKSPATTTNHLNLPRPANAAGAGADGDNESSDTDAASREEVAQNEGRLKRYVPAFGLDSQIPLRGLRIGPPPTSADVNINMTSYTTVYNVLPCIRRSGQLLISAWTNTSAADGKRAAHVDARKWAR